MYGYLVIISSMQWPVFRHKLVSFLLASEESRLTHNVLNNHIIIELHNRMVVNDFSKAREIL